MVKKILYSDSTQELLEGILEIIELKPDKVQFVFQSKDVNLSVVNKDYFSALQAIRLCLEQENIVLFCNGASKNVYPSPMMRDMGDGEKAYRFRDGHHASLSDVVNIFEYDSDKHIICSVSEQEDYYNRWRKSKKKHGNIMIQEKYTSYSKDILVKQFDNGELLNYLFFWGHQENKDGFVTKSCFSQWYPSLFVSNDAIYKTAEHWMMAEKARLFRDEEILAKILKAVEPKETKLLGRKIKGFKEDIWDKNKFSIVKKGNYLKFSQNIQLRNFLINTGDSILVEASPYDLIWGIGMKQDDKGIENPHNWKGDNLLGFALMEVRDMLNGANH